MNSAFDAEVEEWIRCGWLRPYAGDYDGVIPLLAVMQVNKGGKVRPVMDYREVNQYVSSHTGESVVIGDKLRRWRKMGTNLKILDARKAYLKLLTRLEFGLSVAPKIMTAIANAVLATSEDLKAGTDSYIDDIIVNEDVVQCSRVQHVLEKYGLDAKPPEALIGSRILGLRIIEEGKRGRPMWSRDNVLEEPQFELSKREVFSYCGKLVAHYPIAGWLRPACSFIKRSANNQNWDEGVNETTKRRCCLKRLRGSKRMIR
jgi:hypothetical protein